MSEHRDIQIVRSVDPVDRGLEVREYLDGSVEFRISGEPNWGDRRNAVRGIQEEARGLDRQSGLDFARRIRRQQEAARVQRREEERRRARQPWAWRVAFIEGSQIMEYSRGRQRAALTFPVGRNRSTYRVDDIILIESYAKRYIERIFPELFTPDREGLTLWQMLADYLELTEQDLKIGYRITGIQTTDARTGQGRAQLRALLFLTDSEAIQLNSRNAFLDLDRDQLSARFDHYHRFQAWSVLLAVGEAGVTVATLPVGGTARSMVSSIARRLGRRLLVRSARRFRRLVLRLLLSKVLRWIVTFSRKVALKVAGKVVQHRERERIRRNLDLKAVDLNWSLILTEAAREAAQEMLLSAWQEAGNRQLTEYLNAGDDELAQLYRRLGLTTPRQIIEHFIIEKVVEIVMRFQQTLIESLAAAVQDVATVPKEDLERRFSTHLRQQMESRLQSPLQLALRNIIEAFFAGRTIE